MWNQPSYSRRRIRPLSLLTAALLLVPTFGSVAWADADTTLTLEDL